MKTTNGKVRLHIGVPTNGPEDWTVTIRAEDHTSGELLFEMDIDPATWVQIGRGLMHSQDAFIGRHLDRVGKEMQVESQSIPRTVTDPVGYQGDKQAIAARQWADQHCASMDAPWAGEGGPEQWEARRTNSGWKLIMRRWVETKETD